MGHPEFVVLGVCGMRVPPGILSKDTDSLRLWLGLRGLWLMGLGGGEADSFALLRNDKGGVSGLRPTLRNGAKDGAPGLRGVVAGIKAEKRIPSICCGMTKVGG
jgi:hypothetical protein